MSLSYEIIDPGTHILVDKKSDMNFLFKENKKLKMITYAVIGFSIITVLGLMIYTSSKANNDDR